jgi:hypothetical protein
MKPGRKTGIPMNMQTRSRAKLLVVVGALFIGAATAQGLAQTGADKQPDKKAAADKKAPGDDKLLTFEMRNKPWGTVFEWLTDKTGRPFISGSVTPPGTFNFIGQQGKKYTIPQVIDIINDGLIAHKWVLLNRGTSFTLVPADEQIDPALVPRVPVKELPEHGNTEIVSIVYQCNSLNAEDSAPEVKKQMGPFGSVITLHTANQLI